MALIKLKGINKIFTMGEIEVRALNDINLQVKEASFTAVSGPSGSGKTTLLNVVGTLDSATTGEYYFDDELIDMGDQQQINRIRSNDIGFIFQNYNLLPVLSAVENVEMSVMQSSMGAKERREQAEYLLEQVGLADRMHNMPSGLSGGQQQRVSVARSLMGKPKLVLADEPTASLDTKNTMQLIDIMLDLNEKLKTTFLFSTHDPTLLNNVRNIIKLIDGEVTDE